MTATRPSKPARISRRRFNALALAAGAAFAVALPFAAGNKRNPDTGKKLATGGWKSAPTGNTFGKPGFGTLPG